MASQGFTALRRLLFLPCIGRGDSQDEWAEEPGKDLEAGRARWILSWSFRRLDHERGELNPTDGRRLQFFEDLVGRRTPEHPLVPLLRLAVGRHSTTDDGLLIMCQDHGSNLTGLSAAGSPRGISGSIITASVRSRATRTHQGRAQPTSC